MHLLQCGWTPINPNAIFTLPESESSRDLAVNVALSSPKGLPSADVTVPFFCLLCPLVSWVVQLPNGFQTRGTAGFCQVSSFPDISLVSGRWGEVRECDFIPVSRLRLCEELPGNGHQLLSAPTPTPASLHFLPNIPEPQATIVTRTALLGSLGTEASQRFLLLQDFFFLLKTRAPSCSPKPFSGNSCCAACLSRDGKHGVLSTFILFNVF